MGLTVATTVEDACGGSFTNPYVTLAAYGPGNGETDIHIFKNLSDNTYTIKTRLYYYKDRDARNAGKRFIQKHKSNHYFIKKNSSVLKAKIYSISISFLLLLKILFLELSFKLFRKNEKNEFYITREVFFKTIQVLMLKKYNDINIFLDMDFKYLT